MKSSGDRSARIILVMLSLVGIGLVFLCTSRYGAGVSPDSSCYISAARSLLSGEGYRYYDGGIYTHWPPLFPTMLAAFGLVGIEPQTGARLLNALAFGLIIFISGHLFLRSMASRTFAMLGTLSVVLSAPLVAVSSMVWSEPVFIALAVLFVLSIARFLHTKSRALLLVVSALAGLSCLQRYAGVALILAGGILIVLCIRNASLWERLKYLVGFGVISCMPPTAWIIRNRIVAGETAGAHHFHLPPGHELGRSAMAAAGVVATWLFPDVPYPAVKAGGLGLILLAAVVAIIAARYRCPDRDDLRWIQVESAAVFGSVFCCFLILSGAGLAWNPDERVMSPAYVFVMVLVFAGAEAASRLLGTLRIGARAGELSGLLLCGLWLLYPHDQMEQCVKHRMRNGAGYYSCRLWQESPLINWLRANPLQGAVYSNVPDGLYLLTALAAKTTPHYYWNTTEFANNMSSSQANYIVWSDNLCWDHLFDLRELASRCQMEPVAEFSDGGVYRFLGDGGVGVHGVHRFWLANEGKHRYALDRRERAALLLHQAHQCTDEGVVFYVYSAAEHPADALPVHQFWSDTIRSRFYTIDEAEKDALTGAHSHSWRYEGIAWYAYPEGRRPTDTLPVYRFWSDTLRAHFYTISEVERDALVQNYPHVWTYEGVVWYAYGK